jgi:mannose-6-phosphate isomerase-like protein (cupin superfamily)
MLTALVLIVAALLAGPTSPAGFVTPAEIDAALKEMPKDAKTYDKPIKTVDVGGYKVTIVILRRVPNPTVADKGLSHDRVTEVYQIISGSGTFESGGTMTGVEPDDLTLQAAGPSQRGDMHNGDSRHVGPGDTIIVPIGLPHRFSKLDSTITYTVTRIEVPGTGK